jgi:DNA invertase Pin-like site-specific DNA recombinase
MTSSRTIGVVVRVSDVKGRDKKGDRFISPAEQVRVATGYCKADGYEVVVIEPSDLNVSHTTALDQRPGMGEALRRIDAGLLDGIAVSSQDRIGTLVLMRELKERLLRAGAVLKIADNPSAEKLDARGYSKLPSEYVSLMHEAQREEIGLRWAAAQVNARSRGVLPQRAPFGYTRDEAGRVVVAEADAAKVRELFRRKANGEPLTAIARSLGWAHSTARQRVMNADYMGVEGLIPPIIKRAEFNAAQAGRRTQQVPPGETTKHLLLQGLARCAGCGRTLKAPRRPRADGSYVQAYFCKNAASEPCPCRAYVHTDDLEAFVLDVFERELRATPRMIDAVAAAHDLEVAEAEAENAEQELRAYLKVKSALDGAAFLDGATARQDQLEAARARVRDLSARVTRLPASGTLTAHWDALSIEERRLVLRGFIDRVEVSRGASGDLAAHVRIVWVGDEIAGDEANAWMAAA